MKIKVIANIYDSEAIQGLQILNLFGEEVAAV